MELNGSDGDEVVLLGCDIGILYGVVEVVHVLGAWGVIVWLMGDCDGVLEWSMM